MSKPKVNVTQDKQRLLEQAERIRLKMASPRTSEHQREALRHKYHAKIVQANNVWRKLLTNKGR